VDVALVLVGQPPPVQTTRLGINTCRVRPPDLTNTMGCLDYVPMRLYGLVSTGAMIGLLLCLGLGESGCASDVANRYYAAEKYRPKPVDQVQLLDHKPDRPYDVIADFQSRGESPQDMRRHAAAIGADAVIVSTLGGYYGSQEEWAQQKDFNTEYTRIVGTAIRYK